MSCVCSLILNYELDRARQLVKAHQGLPLEGGLADNCTYMWILDNNSAAFEESQGKYTKGVFPQNLWTNATGVHWFLLGQYCLLISSVKVH